ncbi:hypothetical protein HDU76_007223, partial [Blyttiomyces sp. JEL0837]
MSGHNNNNNNNNNGNPPHQQQQQQHQHFHPLQYYQDGNHTLHALDTVLFNGKDAVAKFIAKVEATQVVPHLDLSNRSFQGLWTHS